MEEPPRVIQYVYIVSFVSNGAKWAVFCPRITKTKKLPSAPLTGQKQRFSTFISKTPKRMEFLTEERRRIPQIKACVCVRKERTEAVLAAFGNPTLY